MQTRSHRLHGARQENCTAEDIQRGGRYLRWAQTGTMRRRCLPFSGDVPAVFAAGVYLLFLRRGHTPLTCRKRLGINFSQEENAYEETHRFSAAGIDDGTEPGTRHCLGSREPRRPGSGRCGKHDLRKGRRRCLGWHAGGQVGGPGPRVLHDGLHRQRPGYLFPDRRRVRLHQRDQRPVRR